jgi:hypothetical protein
MTINEVRKEQGLKPLENGDILLNPQYIQYILQQQQAAAMQGGGDTSGMGGDENGNSEESNQEDGEESDSEEGFGSDDMDSMVDEAMSGIEGKMQKAFRLI